MEHLIRKLPSIPIALRSFKTPTTLGTYGSLPKIRKGRFGSLSPLGVKEKIKFKMFLFPRGAQTTNDQFIVSKNFKR
jgi:hypothetical protein